MRHFVVLSSQRSGSTWLISLLNQLDDAAAFGELFLHRRRTAESDHTRFEFDYPRYLESSPAGLRPWSVFAYLDQFYERSGTVGFKLMYSQWRKYPELLLYFWRHHVQIVHLVRRNHLNVLLSRHIKNMTQQAHLVSAAGLPLPRFDPVELDATTLVRRLRLQQWSIAAARQLLRLNRLPHLELAYEDLLQDPAHFDCLWEFLDINPQRHSPSIAPQKNSHPPTPRPHRQL
jgi:LPS sulfotransferase NodH